MIADLPMLVDFAAAFLGPATAFAVGWSERRSIAHWSFMAGALLLAAESAFVGMTSMAVTPQEVVYWQNWRFLAMSLLPGTWLLFSLTYGRGNYREFLTKWRALLIAAFLL